MKEKSFIPIKCGCVFEYFKRYCCNHVLQRIKVKIVIISAEISEIVNRQPSHSLHTERELRDMNHCLKDGR